MGRLPHTDPGDRRRRAGCSLTTVRRHHASAFLSAGSGMLRPRPLDSLQSAKPPGIDTGAGQRSRPGRVIRGPEPKAWRHARRIGAHPFCSSSRALFRAPLPASDRSAFAVAVSLHRYCNGQQTLPHQRESLVCLRMPDRSPKIETAYTLIQLPAALIAVKTALQTQLPPV
jgi:hypothetical protein